MYIKNFTQCLVDAVIEHKIPLGRHSGLYVTVLKVVVFGN